MRLDDAEHHRGRPQRGQHRTGDRAVRDGERAATGQPYDTRLSLPPVQVQPDEPGDIVGAGPAGHLGRRALLHHPSGLDDDDVVGQHHGLDRVVGHQHGRATEPAEMAAQVPSDGQPGGRVQRRQRLVQQQQLRARGERSGERDPLSLPAGERPGPAGGELGQPERLQPAQRGGPGGGPRDSPAAQPEGDVVPRGQMREQQVVLKNHPDRAALCRDEDSLRRVVQDEAGQADPARVDRLQPGQRPQQGGLARAVGPENGDGRPARRGQRHVQGEAAGPPHSQACQQRAVVGSTAVRRAGPSRRPVPLAEPAHRAHRVVPGRSQRSRSRARTTTATTSRTRDSAVAVSGSVSRAR